MFKIKIIDEKNSIAIYEVIDDLAEEQKEARFHVVELHKDSRNISSIVPDDTPQNARITSSLSTFGVRYVSVSRTRAEARK